MSVRGPVLALDFGTQRIGLAVSDAAAEFAFPLAELECRDEKRDREAICALAAERGVVQLVVGLPLHMDGHAGPEAEAARSFAQALGAATGLPVELLDERWTTREARRALRDVQPRRRKRERARVDSAAASLLLRTFLDRARHAGGCE
ncbi:MAG: Holliday junction resolvase RuvX [Myxococcota bacterium]|jgi:putative Holliday junction resolvase|nr:Holliday junction resolvase RuvX [Deltaproteobacteria bacterium]MCP4241997.1 Holliday junction resolvase RuvX [bacterium]MDP6074993.1 Holliday junction resolvase RuvX [Myxococcota bacterium]MBT38615.1 Holliday junction resolvase RuvX [Deltaproteobacteria bacterium]MDP6244166.1 Holliday junction resolvase RuvX [Myxococcota bacterium]